MVNRGAAALFTALGVGADGATPPNLIELLLGALRASIVNDGDVLRDTYQRLRRDLAHRPGDARLVALLGSVSGALDALPGKAQPAAIGADSPVLLTKFRTAVGPVDTLSVMVHFSGAHDVTVHDLHVELIYPADTQAATVLQQLTTAM